MSTLARKILQLTYEEAAQEYLRKLPLKHFMESTFQATQRLITLASLALVQERRPEVQYFNELLVQYPIARRKRPGQVVPDNMVVLHTEPIKARGSYDIPLQPVAPYWVLEYVSPSTRRKDYTDSMFKYEHQLMVPYYLLFTLDDQEMSLFLHDGNRYNSVIPNEHGRCPLPDLELEVGLFAGWVRYWFRGQQLPLPGELQRRLDQSEKRALAAEQRAQSEYDGRLEAEQRADQEHRERLAAEERAEQESRLRRELEEEMKKLRAQFAALPKPPDHA
jgi:Uma2 family endonuclease